MAISTYSQATQSFFVFFFDKMGKTNNLVILGYKMTLRFLKGGGGKKGKGGGAGGVGGLKAERLLILIC